MFSTSVKPLSMTCASGFAAFRVALTPGCMHYAQIVLPLFLCLSIKTGHVELC